MNVIHQSSFNFGLSIFSFTVFAFLLVRGHFKSCAIRLRRTSHALTSMT
jgi:hypothetical protein